MNAVERVDPEAREGLAAVLDLAGPGGMWSPDLAERRAFFTQLQTAGREGPPPGVVQEDVRIPGDVRVQVSRPAGTEGRTLPGVLCIHGGGFVIGSPETDQAMVLALVEGLGAAVVSPDYRLAPEHPHPAPVEDCHAALAWMATAEGIDPDRIALFGVSAGGGLAAATALLARDRGTVRPVLQVLASPMLDDRCDAPSHRDVPAIGIWDYDVNAEGWRLLLPGGGADAYAAPARATDLAGLPPALVDVGELDVLRDETIAYATRLLQAGVPTELHVWRGAFHAVEQIAPDAGVAREIMRARIGALARALA